MDSDKPRFSVLIPSRERIELIEHSVRSVLMQEYPDFEIVISDNASVADYTATVAKFDDPRIRLFRSDTPLSVTANWNRALSKAQGTYFVMLGDDDALAPGY